METEMRKITVGTLTYSIDRRRKYPLLSYWNCNFNADDAFLEVGLDCRAHVVRWACFDTSGLSGVPMGVIDGDIVRIYMSPWTHRSDLKKILENHKLIRLIEKLATVERKSAIPDLENLVDGIFSETLEKPRFDAPESFTRREYDAYRLG